jgi:hypothetical protein
MGPYKNDSQYAGGLPTLVIPSAISGKMGKFGPSAPITSSRVPQGGSTLFQNQGGVTRPPSITPGGRSVMAPNATPVTYNSGLFPNAGGSGITGNIPTFAQQYTDTSYGGQQDVYRGGKVQFNPQGAGVTGAGADTMHPEEKKWKILADKYGVDWDVTKATYMRSPRNPSFSPSVALELQLDDKAWGDAAFRAGILTGDRDYDKNVWDDHYLANGNMARDPMAGHNYAIMDYQANQQKIKDQVNGIPQPPEWLG